MKLFTLYKQYQFVFTELVKRDFKKKYKRSFLGVLAGIMPPTKGSVHVNGSIALLLELGAGFDGDLTVKENVFLRRYAGLYQRICE